VWHPGGAWVGFDPTTGNAVDERYVRVAVARDYSDAAPARGHVIFATPLATTTRGDAPVVEVSISRVRSLKDPLAFAADSETVPGDDAAGRRVAGAPLRPSARSDIT
jgi:hypothetical protein